MPQFLTYEGKPPGQLMLFIYAILGMFIQRKTTTQTYQNKKGNATHDSKLQEFIIFSLRLFTSESWGPGDNSKYEKIYTERIKN